MADTSHRRCAAVGSSALLAAGAAAGTIRGDVDPADVFASLGGVSLASGQPAQRDQPRRLLDLLMDGLRYGARRGRPRPAPKSAGS